MKTSVALKKTLNHLWDGFGTERITTRFICTTSALAGVDRIVKPIMVKLLDGHHCYEDWLRYKWGIKDAERNFPKLQRSRKLWLEHLIQHYKSIGD